MTPSTGRAWKPKAGSASRILFLVNSWVMTQKGICAAQPNGIEVGSTFALE